MKRRSFLKHAVVASSAMSLYAPTVRVQEFPLPLAGETHELVQVPGSPTVLISQMEPSRLVKVVFDGKVTSVRPFPLGRPGDGAHGLEISKAHPGRVWCTLEHADQLLLLDPHADEPDRPPTVERVIDVPGGARGPHYVGEYGDELWVTCKGTDQVLRVQHGDPRHYRLYDARPHPIFVARHGDSGVFWVSEDLSSSILRIDPTTHETRHVPVPKAVGATPVGLVSGPCGVWVTLLGTESKGTGTFGRLDAEGEFVWLKLRDGDSGLLHIAFETSAATPVAWLVSSSIINPAGRDAVIRVRLDPSCTRIVAEETTDLPTQRCKAHRVLPVEGGALVTEMASSTLAQI